MVVPEPTHREFKPAYFRWYYGYKEDDFVTGFQKRPCNIDWREEENIDMPTA
jgi:hypothetical protein